MKSEFNLELVFIWCASSLQQSVVKSYQIRWWHRGDVHILAGALAADGQDDGVNVEELFFDLLLFRDLFPCVVCTRALPLAPPLLALGDEGSRGWVYSAV